MPFCDNEVVRASLAVPPALNLHGDTTEKEVLRRAFEDILPAEIARRPKYALLKAAMSVSIDQSSRSLMRPWRWRRRWCGRC